jgi:mRNA-degrading endonuclease RelE of RelBE toxin-antitoxin system
MSQLMMHRTVLKDFGRLPAKVQKKVYELIRKFDEDSTQSSIHLEHVNGACDAKVRSARVGDDYRAIVIAPEAGDMFLLMHVDHHDEAYAWVRNKRFEAHRSLGTLQVFDVVEAEAAVEPALADPVVDQSYPLDDLSDDDLYAAGVPEALIPAVRAVRDDIAFEQLADYLPAEAAQVLFGVVSGMALDESITEMLGGENMPGRKPTGPGDFSHLAEAAGMDLVLVEGEEQLRSILSEDFEEWRVFLHPYQRKIVQWDVAGPMKVNGAAGTGKTVALMHRSVWLARRCEPSDRILVTTYTTNLSVTIKGLIERLMPEGRDRIEVTNLHQLARTIAFRGGWRGKIADDSDIDTIWSDLLARREFAAIGVDGEFLREEFAEVVDRLGVDSEDAYLTVVRSGRPRLLRKQRKVVWPVFMAFYRELNKRNLLTFNGVVHQARLVLEQGGFPKYRHVLVDELQDFGLEALRLIAALSPLSEQSRNPLCVVGDGHQRLYNRAPIPLSRAGIDVRGRSRRLKINYRTSEQIRRWAQALLNGVDIDDLDGSAVTTVGDRSVFKGPEPQIVSVEDINTAGKAVIAWVRNLLDAGYGTHEICVTGGDSRLMAILSQDGLPTLELQARQSDPGHKEPGVRFGTKRRIKGLEFRAVALLLGDSDDDPVGSNFANYVAATRAREQLLVVSGVER